MSLQTDIIFVHALQQNSSLMAKLPAGDVYNTAIALPEQDAENAPVPYIIVTYDGMSNDQTTKDSYESEYDSVTIGIEVAAQTRGQLCEIVEAVRATVLEYFTDLQNDESSDYYPLLPLDYQLTATGVRYDDMKPCYWQILNYQCETKVYGKNEEE